MSFFLFAEGCQVNSWEEYWKAFSLNQSKILF